MYLMNKQRNNRSIDRANNELKNEEAG